MVKNVASNQPISSILISIKGVKKNLETTATHGNSVLIGPRPTNPS